jgi:hypothetical protein
LKLAPESEAELQAKLSIASSKREKEEAALIEAERQTKTAELLLEDDKKLLIDQQRAHKKWLKQQAADIDISSHKLKDLKAQIREAKHLAKEAEDYKKEQDALVEDAVAAHNTRLVELHADINITERLKDEALRDLAAIQEQVSSETDNLEALGGKLEALTTLYHDTATRYKLELNDYRAQIKTSQIELNRKRKDSQAIVQRLAEKEKELGQREEILDTRDAKQAEEAEFLRKKRARMGT